MLYTTTMTMGSLNENERTRTSAEKRGKHERGGATRRSEVDLGLVRRLVVLVGAGDDLELWCGVRVSSLCAVRPKGNEAMGRTSSRTSSDSLMRARIVSS